METNDNNNMSLISQRKSKIRLKPMNWKFFIIIPYNNDDSLRGNNAVANNRYPQ